jgi:hypothetical protein
MARKQDEAQEAVSTPEEDASSRVVKTSGMLVDGGTPKQQDIAKVAQRLAAEDGHPNPEQITVRVVQLVGAADRRVKTGKMDAPLRSRQATEARKVEKQQKRKARLEEQMAKLQKEMAEAGIE